MDEPSAPDRYEADLPDSADSVVIPDYLRASSEDAVLPPATTDPEVLPFCDRSPRDFERCCLLIAERVDGLRDARLFGKPGQAQDGIDIVGWDDTGSVDYQVKRYREFTAPDLKAAVDRFAAGRRPFHPHRFVVCVSSAVDDTATLEALGRLRAEVDFELDLYDQRRLSELLRGRPDLVNRMFGPAWVAVFNAGDLPRPPRPEPTDQLADAVLRGPLRSAGLDGKLADAETYADRGDHDRAAELLGAIVDELESKGFGSLAEPIRRRFTEELVLAGQDVDAANLLAAMAWKAISTSAVHTDRASERQLEQLADRLDSLVPVLKALTGIQRWHVAPSHDLGQYVANLDDALAAGSPLADQLVLWFAESAIAIRDEPTLSRLSALLGTVAAGRRAQTGPDDELVVRLNCCLADATGDWTELVAAARRGDVAPSLASLVMARHGRWLAWSGSPDEADSTYREAVRFACTAHLGIDGAHALRSAAEVRFRYGPWTSDVFEAGRLAARLDAQGGTLASSSRNLVDAGLAVLAAGRHPEALRYLRFALREHVVMGHLDGELAAHRALARLLHSASVPDLAICHATWAGSDDIAKTIEGPNQTSTTSLVAPAPWERAVALSTLARRADIVTDDVVEAIARLALAATEGVRQSRGGPQVWLSGWRLVAALADRLPDDLAYDILRKLRSDVSRPPGQTLLHDDEHVEIVAAIHETHPRLQEHTAPHLLDLVALDGEVAESARRYAGDLMAAQPDVFLPTLMDLAAAGNAIALNLLVELDAQTPALLEHAAAVAQAVIDRPTPEPRVFSFGTGLIRSAFLARVLDAEARSAVARHVVTEAEDHHRPEANRTEALRAIRALADRLPADVRQEVCDRCLAIAQDPGPEHPVDLHLSGGRHPLSTFRINLGFGVLSSEAGRTAAVLADNDPQRVAVANLLAPWLLVDDDRITYAAAHGLSCLPPERRPIDPALLIELPSVWPRQLAAATWISRAHDAPELGHRFVADPDVRVRRALATGLERLAETMPQLAHELAQSLRSDDCWSVRRLVPPSLGSGMDGDSSIG